MGAARRAVLAAATALLVTLGVFAGATTASAAAGDVGIQGPSFSGATNAPTADKPQSKMWYTADGQWWADMFDATSKTWHIFSLNRAAKTWTDTGVQVDTRANTSSDALWDGTYLYIGTHVVRTGTNSSSTTSPMRLYRYSYNSSTKTWALNSGFPKTISNFSSESLTIDRDSAGTVWATWTVVSGTTGKVYVNDGSGNGSTWGAPFVMPTTGGLNKSNVNPNVAVDDISALVAFGQNKIGVLWSNQSDGFVYWSVHNAGAPRATWTGGYAVQGSKIPDDHLNLKSIQADAQGRVFAAVKTSLDHGTNRPTDPQINLLQYKPGTGPGTWSSTTFGTIADCHTRPQVLLDESAGKVYVFATGKTGTGTCTSNGDGAIYYKSTSIDAPSFSAGSGTIALRDATSESLNNVTLTKQSATSLSGVVVLASNNVTKRYWWNDIVPGSGTTATAPVASFTATPTSGTAPLTVAFTNTSTGSPTPTYSWAFGDGGTSTATSPSHSYSAAGTYSVRLTATNSAGTNTSAAQTITVTTSTSAAPTASFTASPTSGTAPLTVAFTNTSTGSPTPTYSWAFGDGGTSTATSPSHSYSAAGTYSVRLTATNSAGTNTSAAQTITVTTSTSAAPTASFTASPTSGTAPLTVAFTNTSTGSPTPTYSWAFGDGGTSTATSPSHTYSAAGTYSVRLTATNSAGTNTSAAQTITVNTTPPSGGTITLVNKSEAGNSAAVTAVTVPQPAGVQAGDVLVAQITADAAPSVSAAPAGWTSVASQTASGARLFVYSHVVTASDTGPYTWTLSTGVKWNAGIAAYRGVNTTTPWDTTPVTAASSVAATTLVVAGVTTQTAAAMLIGGVAVNSSSSGVTPPAGWTEALEATGVQVTEMAHKIQQTPGSSGGATWTLTGSYYAAGWMGALKPA